MDLTQITAIVKTFERPRSLDRLLRSIRRFYPDMRVLVGDDSFRPSPRDDVRYVRLDPDVGASAGRNALLERVDTPLVLQLDDDFEFTRATRIERLAGPVVEEQAELTGGECIRCRRKWFGWVRRKRTPYHGLIDLQGGVLRLSPGDRGAADDRDVYLHCDITPQFFVARMDALRAAGGWDADLKTEEHEELFVRLQQRGARVLYCPQVEVLHWSDMPAHYAPFRRRSYRPLAAAKMGVHTWIDMDGRVTRFDSAEAA